jgi:hypothetical protein
VHYASFPLFVSATIHGLTAGTDTTRHVAVLVALVVGVAFCTMIGIRAAMSVTPVTPAARPIARPQRRS